MLLNIKGNGTTIFIRLVLRFIDISSFKLLQIAYILPALFVILFLLVPVLIYADSVGDGVAFLISNQQTNGSWTSVETRSVHVTAEALRALQTVGAGGVTQTVAADFLEAAHVRDTDALARRIDALAAEGGDILLLVNELLAAADPLGGWGLLPEFSADPLDTALALMALASAGAANTTVVDNALFFLVASQNPDGGWACVERVQPFSPSDVSCTAQVLTAFNTYRSRFFIEPAITAAQNFLRAAINPDGSIGGRIADALYTTALAVRALLESGDSLADSRSTVLSFLEGAQRVDGSWEGDALFTAVVLRATACFLDVSACAGSPIPFCGDGVINQPTEACDGPSLNDLTCVDLGFGSGSLHCSAACTFDTDECLEPPTSDVPPVITSIPVTLATASQLYRYNVQAVNPRDAFTFLGPNHYLSFTNSPFTNRNFDYFYLEDFEDRVLNTLGVRLTGGAGTIGIESQAFRDSVDADNGPIDGDGRQGQSLFTRSGSIGFTFTFDPGVLGALPTHAGIVWTDAESPRSASIFFQAFDAVGSSLGVFGPHILGDGTTAGTTAEDRFLGVSNPQGVSAIRIFSNAQQIEVDHLQYGKIHPLMFSLDVAPNGMIINTVTGQITWTPDNTQVRTHSITVRVENEAGLSTLQMFTVSVTPVPLPSRDFDGDGFPADIDCDDTNANINPGMTETFNNGIDDDCNPGTPDFIPSAELACTVTTDKVSYSAQEEIRIEFTLRRTGGTGSVAGLELELTVASASGVSLGNVAEPLLSLAPDERRERNFFFSTGTTLPGLVSVMARVLGNTAILTSCATATAIASSVVEGAPLTGTITAEPAQALFGDQVNLLYQVENIGNVALESANLTILVVRPATGEVAITLGDTTTLLPGGVFQATRTLSSGLAIGEYLIILQGGPPDALATLATASLRIKEGCKRPPGDLDGDCDVDYDDLTILLRDRNKPVGASACGLPCDLDGDGSITALDARKLTLLCTRPRCATQ